MVKIHSSLPNMDNTVEFKKLKLHKFIERFSLYEIHIIDNKTEKVYTLANTDADFSRLSEDAIDLHYDFREDLEEINYGIW